MLADDAIAQPRTGGSDLETARRSMLAIGVSADAIARSRAVLEQAVQAGTLESVARAPSLQSGDEMTFVPLLVVLASTATAGDVPRSG
uniref:hypothetical protein n=1 Tax=Corallococcus coralloides TaxID=184914 RepID=UPI000FFE8236|nr:hypothetical protein [Corallococcus coralloides]